MINHILLYSIINKYIHVHNRGQYKTRQSRFLDPSIDHHQGLVQNQRHIMCVCFYEAAKNKEK